MQHRGAVIAGLQQTAIIITRAFNVQLRLGRVPTTVYYSNKPLPVILAMILSVNYPHKADLN